MNNTTQNGNVCFARGIYRDEVRQVITIQKGTSDLIVILQNDFIMDSCFHQSSRYVLFKCRNLWADTKGATLMKQILSVELDSHFNFQFSMAVSVIFFISYIKCDRRDTMRVKREIEIKKEKGQ